MNFVFVKLTLKCKESAKAILTLNFNFKVRKAWLNSVKIQEMKDISLYSVG